MSAEILNSDVNKILDYFLIADSELENKSDLLKNIDQELDISDDFPIVNQKKNEENDEFVDVVEGEDNEKSDENKEKEKKDDEELVKSMEILSLDTKENEGNEKEKENKEEKKENENEESIKFFNKFLRKILIF